MKHLIFLFLCFSCGFQHNSLDNDMFKFGVFPLLVPEQNSLMAQWEKKPVLESRLIDNMESGSNWVETGIGEINYTQERAKDGKQSLRFHTSLRDEEHYRKHRTPWNSYNGPQGGSSSIHLKFDQPQDWSAFNRLSFWVYVHPSSKPTYSLVLQIDNKGKVFNSTTYSSRHNVQDLKPGVWNHVLYEIPHQPRDKVTQLIIEQTLIGFNPGEKGTVTYDFDCVEIQKVQADQFEGWTVAPDKFAFSHIGYRPDDPKIALVSDGAGTDFKLINQKDKIVYSGKVSEIKNKNGAFHQLDFSDFCTQGTYRIRCGALESNPFPIHQDIWIQPIYRAVNFFFCERCGFDVPGIHLACHKDWQSTLGDTNKIINGGWHDAGDLSQGYFRTAIAVYSMISNLESLKERADVGALKDRINDEICWGLEWLLKVRFGKGYHSSWSTMRIYTDNKVGTIDDVVSQAKNIPWENFLAAAVFVKASRIIEKSNPELSLKARLAALEDWNDAMASRDIWDKAEYREAAWGTTSSILLGELTGDKKYMEQAIHFGNLLIKCQEQRFVDGIPIAGYFYETTSRTKVIHNFHHGFEEAPLIALTMLCRAFPEDKNWMNWYGAVVLHSEFFMKRGSQISFPFCLLPNSVWKKSEILAEKDSSIREDMMRQFKDGTRLNEDYVLRTFPVYRNYMFHGNTMIQMACTWALAEASKLRNDPEGMALVGKQLQWVFGANPFGQSLMYGVGYDFAPQFALCLKNVVGSMPVGMDCLSGDMPNWSATNCATSKEIWVEPVNRFLGAVSIYNAYNQITRNGNEPDNPIQISTKIVDQENGIVTIDIKITGSGKHELDLLTFNATTDFKKRPVDLADKKTGTVRIKMNVVDLEMPYLMVITADKNLSSRKEVIGSFITTTILMN